MKTNHGIGIGIGISGNSDTAAIHVVHRHGPP
jgi:hypothetical protein